MRREGLYTSLIAAWRKQQDQGVRQARADVLAAAYERHPERFVRKHPEPRALPEVAWINKPPSQAQRDEDTTHSRVPEEPASKSLTSSAIDSIDFDGE